MAALFEGATTIRVRALLLGERLDTRLLETLDRLATQPLMVRAGERGACVLFRWGAAVFFHTTPVEQLSLLEQLGSLVGDRYSKPEAEEGELQLSPERAEGVESGVIHVSALSVERMQLIAEILARSTALARYEGAVRQAFERIEPWAVSLQTRGTGGQPERLLLRNLGGTLLIQHQMAGRIEIADKPELLWERPDLERIYLRLEDEYELKEREVALDRKLAIITGTSETLLEIVKDNRSTRLEWYIILLICAELGISLYNLLNGLLH